MLDLLALETFVRIADSGSLSAAARGLGRSLPAVSRSLVQLESHLGVRLLQRTTRSIHLTDAGAQYLERCRRILAEVEEANASISESARAVTGPIAVTAPVLFGQMVVAPVVTEFLALHPGTSVQLILTDRYVNVIDEGIDLAVRVGELIDSGLVARKLGEVRRVVCAAPDYLKRKGTPKVPRDLANHNCLQFIGLSPSPYWEFLVGGKLRQVRVHGTFAVSHGAAAIDAARAGLGIVRALSYQLQAAVRAGELRVVLARFEPAPISLNVVVPTRRMLPTRVRLLADLLEARTRSTDFKKLAAAGKQRGGRESP